MWSASSKPASTSPACDAVVGGDVALDAVVHGRRALLHRRLGIEHARDRLVVDVDQLHRAQRGRLVDRDHGRDALALVADDAVGERGLVLDERAVLGLRHVGLRVDREHARHRGRRRGVDRDDPARRVRAAQDLAVEHPGQPHVVGVRRLAGDLLVRVGARQRLAHDAVLGRPVLAHLHRLAGRGHDRVDDPRVAGAAAQVAADRLAHLVLGRRRVGGQERLRGHDHPRRAVAALGREVVANACCTGSSVPLWASPSIVVIFVPLGLHREHEARVDDVAVEVHGARRALALVARAFGAGQPEVVAQHVGQRPAGSASNS